MHHFVYGSDGALMSFEIWETNEDLPILGKLAFESCPPQIWALQWPLQAPVEWRESND
jgi:hypothetical protein